MKLRNYLIVQVATGIEGDVDNALDFARALFDHYDAEGGGDDAESVIEAIGESLGDQGDDDEDGSSDVDEDEESDDDDQDDEDG